MFENVKSVEIKFKPRSGSKYGNYYGGQKVEGIVEAIIEGKGQKMRGISVTFFGGAKVEMKVSKKTWRGFREEKATNSQLYFNNTIWLFGDGSETVIPAGTHQLPFTYTLPTNLPPSLEGPDGKGHIRYHVKANLEIPNWVDSHFSAPITILKKYDLNLDPTAKQPIEITEGKNVKVRCFCCCNVSGGPFRVKLHVRQGGYVPGESIVFYAELDNSKCEREIEKAYAVLKRETVYVSKSRERSKLFWNLSEPEDHQHLGIPAKSKDVWEHEVISIPLNLIPSKLGNCWIIEINYYLEFVVQPSGISSPLKLRIPIAIGTTPLKSSKADISEPARVEHIQKHKKGLMKKTATALQRKKKHKGSEEGNGKNVEKKKKKRKLRKLHMRRGKKHKKSEEENGENVKKKKKKLRKLHMRRGKKHKKSEEGNGENVKKKKRKLRRLPHRKKKRGNDKNKEKKKG